jgi:hypothetical protein
MILGKDLKEIPGKNSLGLRKLWLQVLVIRYVKAD